MALVASSETRSSAKPDSDRHDLETRGSAKVTLCEMPRMRAEDEKAGTVRYGWSSSRAKLR